MKSIQYNSLHRSPFLMFPSDQQYKEYLEDVAVHCSEDIEETIDAEETIDVEETTEDGKNVLYNHN
jgi:hypothetical protein